jgi:hypothetical protein
MAGPCGRRAGCSALCAEARVTRWRRADAPGSSEGVTACPTCSRLSPSEGGRLSTTTRATPLSLSTRRSRHGHPRQPRQQISNFYRDHAARLHRGICGKTVGLEDATVEDACAAAWERMLGRPDIDLERYEAYWWLYKVALRERGRSGAGSVASSRSPHRLIGRVRPAGSKDGLTRSQAEAAHAGLRGTCTAPPRAGRSSRPSMT